MFQFQRTACKFELTGAAREALIAATVSEMFHDSGDVRGCLCSQQKRGLQPALIFEFRQKVVLNLKQRPD